MGVGALTCDMVYVGNVVIVFSVLMLHVQTSNVRGAAVSGRGVRVTARYTVLEVIGRK